MTTRVSGLDRKARRRWGMLIILLLLLGVLCLGGILFSQGVREFQVPEFIPVDLASVLEADYGVDSNPVLIPGVRLAIIWDTIRDREPEATDVEARQAALLTSLLTPVPTVTPSLCQGSHTIYAGQDTWIDSANPTATHGSEPRLRVGHSGNDFNRLLLYFPITNTIAAGTFIYSARLEINFDPTTGPAVPQSVRLFSLAGSFAESTANWSNQPEPQLHYRVTELPAPHIQAWDVTEMVRDWLLGRFRNEGLMLEPDGPVDFASIYYSREADLETGRGVVDEPVRVGPRLVIDCGGLLPPPEAIAVALPSPTPVVTEPPRPTQESEPEMTSTPIPTLALPLPSLAPPVPLPASPASTPAVPLPPPTAAPPPSTLPPPPPTGTPLPPDDNDDDDNPPSPPPPLPPPSADMTLSKSASPNPVNAGNNLTYTLTVTNTGPSDATGVTITDTLPVGVTFGSATPGCTPSGGIVNCALGNLAANNSRQVTITVTLDPAITNGTVINNTATTAGNETDPTPGNNTATEPTTVDKVTDLAIAKTGSPDPVIAGEALTYTLFITNSGPSDATGLVVTDTLPAGVTFASAAGCTNAGGTVTCSVGSLAAGASMQRTIVVTVSSGTTGPVSNSVIVGGNEADPTGGNNSASITTTVTTQADLVVSKTVDNATPDEGETIAYTIVVTNNGPSDATNVVLTDTLPVSVTYVADSAGLGSYNSSTGGWSVGTLTNTLSAALVVTVTVDAGTSGQTITNTTDGLSLDQTDPNSSNNTGSVAVTVTSADLAVSKVVNTAAPNEGATIVYTVVVTNNGPSNASGVQLIDVLPGGVTYISDDSGGAYNAGSGLWTVGSLANGAGATLIITATVDGGTAGQTITNTAGISASNQGDPASGNNSAGASLTVTNADLALTKTVDNNSPNPNDTIAYTITVTNNGPDNAGGVVISDTLPLSVTFVTSSTSQGSYNSGSGLWTVGSLANGAGATLIITTTVNTGTTGTVITNLAEVNAAGQSDANSANNRAGAIIGVGGADLAVSKTVNNATPNQGDTIVYTLAVTNTGPISVTGVVLTDTLPLSITFVASGATQGSYNSGSGLWTVGSLANGAGATLIITATVDNGTAGQTITNTTGGLSADQPDPEADNDTGSAAITVTGADLAVSKTVDLPQPAANDTIVYTIVVTNSGPVNATGAALTDTLPISVTYVSANPGQGTYTNTTGLWAIGSLTNGATATLVITATVNPGTLGQTIDNTAGGLSADQPDPDTGNNSASASITVVSTMHVGDLDGVSTPSGSNKWIATVTITVHDTGHNPIQGVTVRGRFSEDGAGSGGPFRECTTDAGGQCSVSTDPIPNSKPESIFTTQKLTHTSYSYSSGDNHDPDGGSSDGTSITIVQGVGGTALPGGDKQPIFLPIILKSGVVTTNLSNSPAVPTPYLPPPKPAPPTTPTLVPNEQPYQLYLPLILK